MASEYFEIKFSVWDYWVDENDILHIIIDIAGQINYAERQLTRIK